MKHALLSFWLLAAAGAACSSSEGAAPIAGSTDAGADAMTDAATTPPRTKRPLCVDGQSVDGPYPKDEPQLAIGGTLPDLSFETDAAPLTMRELFEPCAAQSRLLVIRVVAQWCGTCLWHAEHTKALAALDVASRLVFLDLLVADEDNMPARPSDLARWSAKVGGGVRAALDPEARLLPINPSRAPLPFYVLVDTRRMEIVNHLNDPDPELLELRIRQELALADGLPQPPSKLSTKVDGTLYRNHRELLEQMTLPAAPPPDPSNAKADDAAAAALGKKLFSDAALSPSSISCATCHDPAKAFTDRVAQSTGVNKVGRNAPSALLAAHSRWQFWDGRADSLWMQALGPIENADEMASTRLFVGHVIDGKYKSEYEAVWGALPPLSDGGRFPAAGKPGDASWQGMTTQDRDAATRVFVNVGKSIAAFERTLRVKPNRLDAYVAGDTNALTDLEKKGLFDFFVTGCAQCHFGPRLTNDAFHTIRFPTGHADGKADRGRVDGVPLLLAAEFNSASAWSDAPSSTRLAALEGRTFPLGAFKTPPLRGTADTAPYGHGGSIPDLAEVTRLYGKAGLDPTDPAAAGTTEPWVPNFSDEHRPTIEAILKVMSGLPEP